MLQFLHSNSTVIAENTIDDVSFPELFSNFKKLSIDSFLIRLFSVAKLHLFLNWKS